MSLGTGCDLGAQPQNRDANCYGVQKYHLKECLNTKQMLCYDSCF